MTLTAADIGGYLMLSGSEVSGDLALTSASVKGYVQLIGSVVCGSLDLERTRIGADVQMFSGESEDDLAEFGSIRMVAAEVAGDVHLGGARVHGHFNAEDLRVGSDLFMNGGARFASIDLSGVRVGGNLAMENSQFQGEAQLTRAHVGSNLDLSGSRFARDPHSPGWRSDCPAGDAPGDGPFGLDLLGAEVTGDLLLQGTEISGKLQAQDPFGSAAIFSCATPAGSPRSTSRALRSAVG